MLRPSRACVHSDWMLYIALPSPTMQITLRSGQAIAAPVATGVEKPIEPPMFCSQSCGAAAAVGDGFVDDDRVLRDRAGDRLGDRGVIERTGWLVEFHKLLRLDVVRPGAERIRQRFQRRHRVLAPRG